VVVGNIIEEKVDTIYMVKDEAMNESGKLQGSFNLSDVIYIKM
jgi:hypothetical protein